ncbi:hypothetical protein UCREL1_224 [Eutypa lata UCREL1]|uniref:Uncharacterized protein n=1 Tax=Eutypa lata (strain UCR-EL1) TaxID=1287681 RepID=M7U1B0_EUTLA|nr:hypothetical protein UCREL1_224 [Eutypa lata UCREL1]
MYRSQRLAEVHSAPAQIWSKTNWLKKNETVKLEIFEIVKIKLFEIRNTYGFKIVIKLEFFEIVKLVQ